MFALSALAMIGFVPHGAAAAESQRRSCGTRHSDEMICALSALAIIVFAPHGAAAAEMAATMEATKNGVRSSKARPSSAGIMTRARSSLITVPDIIALIPITPEDHPDCCWGLSWATAGTMGTDMDMGTEAGATADGEG